MLKVGSKQLNHAISITGRSVKQRGGEVQTFGYTHATFEVSALGYYTLYHPTEGQTPLNFCEGRFYI